MPLPTCAVTCVMHGQDGQPEPGATFEFRLNRYEVYDGFVVPEISRGTADENGMCVLNLWPNQLGSTGSAYEVTMRSTRGKSQRVLAVVPAEAAAQLHEISQLPPYPGKVDGQIQLEAAIEASQQAIAARDVAADTLAMTITAKDQAVSAKTAAESARDAAQLSEVSAGGSASAAATSESVALAQAGVATTQATAANTARVASQAAQSLAEAARDAALLAEDGAEAALTSATTQAGIATTKAAEADADRIAAEAAKVDSQAARDTAQTAATTATAQAGIATTKASEAAASAAAAATFDPALYVPRAGNVTLTGPLSVPAGASGAQVPQAQEVGELTSQQIGLAGQVAFFARSTAPAGWLKANGATVSRTAYSRLFAAIGTQFGAGDGSTTFMLPDLRGVFIRGLDEGRGIDPSRAFGSYQDHAYQNTQFYIQRTIGLGRIITPISGPIWTSDGGNTGGPAGEATGRSVTIVSFGAGTETRPTNVALVPCIKF